MLPRAVPTWELRATFARRMAATYGEEVPAYNLLVEESMAVNRAVIAREGSHAERFGTLDRVTAERHGAVRLGTPAELAALARVFAALGMFPVGFYDLREAARSAVPVVSTAFRPIAAEELARNPFRMFTSLLVPDDRRFFDADLQKRVEAFLSRRTLFPPELLDLADIAQREGGLDEDQAERFLELATSALRLSPQPVDRAWYAELEAVSAVAADIAGVSSTHINHLTPRVLDIDELYRRMSSRGITMIDTIQGPPSWDGVDVLLRQTSFRALDERRLFRQPDGRVVRGSLRVRFGEVESRGIAVTPAGRDRYDAALAEVEARSAVAPETPRPDIARAVWVETMPATESQLAADRLGYFRYEPADRSAARPGDPLTELVAHGAVRRSPIVYEDFLPRSAAGIFQSNLLAAGRRDDSEAAASRDAGWLSGIIGVDVADPYSLYEAEQDASIRTVAEAYPVCRVSADLDPRKVLL